MTNFKSVKDIMDPRPNVEAPEEELHEEFEAIKKKMESYTPSEKELADADFIWEQVQKGTPDDEIMRALGYTEEEIALCSPIDEE